MNFIWPSALLLLVVVAGLAVLYVLAQRRRNRYALRYANLSLVREAIGKGPGWRTSERFRSEEHTSELQSHHDLVCRLLLEKKKLIIDLCATTLLLILLATLL